MVNSFALHIADISMESTLKAKFVTFSISVNVSFCENFQFFANNMLNRSPVVPW